MTTPDPVQVTISPEPTGAELAAILAAYRELWRSAPAPDPAPPVSLKWKFSGRWWHQAPLRGRL